MGMSGLWWDASSSDLTADYSNEIWGEEQFCELVQGDACKFGGLVAFFLVQHVWMTLVEFWFHLVAPCQLKML